MMSGPMRLPVGCRYLIGSVAAVVVLGLAVSPVRSEPPAEAELHSGLQVGEKVPTFYSRAVTGPLMNKSVCYVCRNGERPVVMLLLRRLSPKLKPLLKGLDRVVDNNRALGLRSFGVLLSDDPFADISTVQTFAFNSEIGMPLTVATKAVGSDGCQKVDAEAAVTIVMYRDREVVANFAFRPGELDEENIAAILSRARGVAGAEK